MEAYVVYSFMNYLLTAFSLITTSRDLVEVNSKLEIKAGSDLCSREKKQMIVKGWIYWTPMHRLLIFSQGGVKNEMMSVVDFFFFFEISFF